MMSLSVVIPTFGRTGRVERLVEELLGQDVSAPIEVVVVEDGSPQGPREGLRAMAAIRPSLRYVWKENGGVAAARNRGVRESTGARILFIDDDMEVDPEFARRHLDLAAANGGAWICGPSPYVLGDRPPRAIDAYRLDLERRWLEGREGAQEVELVTGANLSVDRARFLEVGGFDEQVRAASAEDYLLGIRARLAGIPVLHFPDLVARHHDPVDAITFGRRQARYAKATAELLGIDPVAASRSRRVRAMAAAHDPRRPLTPALRALKIRARLLAAHALPLGTLEAAVRLAERLALSGAPFARLMDTLISAQAARGWGEGRAAAAGFRRREEGRRAGERVTAVVVSYNTADLLEAALASVAAQAATAIVVDNASTDDSVERVRRRAGDVRLIANAENVGFARANNQALAQVTTEFALLLNSDAEAAPGAVEALVRFMDGHALAGVASGGLDGTDGVSQKPARRFPAVGRTLAEGLRLHKLLPSGARGRWLLGTYWDEAGPRPVDWVWGTFLLVRMEAVREVGGFDERHFMYGEDIEWCARMWGRGWQCWIVPEARALHHGGRSAALTWDRAQRDGRIWKETYRVVGDLRGTTYVALLKAATALAYSVEGVVRLLKGRPSGEWRYYLRTAVAQWRGGGA